MKSVVTRTPLRISLFGGGTDLESFYSKYTGHVLSIAISKYIYVTVQESEDNRFHLFYMDTEEVVENIEDIKHDIVREAIHLVDFNEKVKITIQSDVTSNGSGLGASSTLSVGVLNALYHYKGEEVSIEDIARQACRLEIQNLNQTIGKQDQYIAAYGGIQHIKFLSNGLVELKTIKNKAAIHALENRLLLFHSGIGRKANDILKEQNVLNEDKTRSLRLMAEQVEVAERFIESNEIDDIGKLLKRAWELKRGLSGKISNEQIDKLIDKLFRAGAEGVKITGAGGGGGILVFHKEGAEDKIKEAVKELVEYPFAFCMEGTTVVESKL